MKLKFRSFSHIPLSTQPHVAGWLATLDMMLQEVEIPFWISSAPGNGSAERRIWERNTRKWRKVRRKGWRTLFPEGDRPTDRLGRRQMACPKYSQWLQWHVCMVVLLCTQYEPIWNCQWTGNYWIHPPPIASSCSDCEENREKERDKHHVLFSVLQVTYQGIVRRALGHCWQIFKDSLLFSGGSLLFG